MVELGYALSSEEFTPRALVRFAQRAEEVGFSLAFHRRTPPIFIAAGGEKAAAVAAKIGDGLITAGDEEKVLNKFNAAGGTSTSGRFCRISGQSGSVQPEPTVQHSAISIQHFVMKIYNFKSSITRIVDLHYKNADCGLLI